MSDSRKLDDRGEAIPEQTFLSPEVDAGEGSSEVGGEVGERDGGEVSAPGIGALQQTAMALVAAVLPESVIPFLNHPRLMRLPLAVLQRCLRRLRVTNNL